MEETSSPPAKRQRRIHFDDSSPLSTTDNNAARHGPVASLLNVPLAVIFQYQPHTNSMAKTKEKPLLSQAEAQAFLQVHYCAQDMDALIATAEAAFRQKLQYLEYEQSICGQDHPMTRSLLPLLQRNSYQSLQQHVSADMNHSILHELEQAAFSLQQFVEMNAATAEQFADISGMEELARAKSNLSELQLEVSQRIAALVTQQVTEENATQWCSMTEYCHRLFPNALRKEVSNESQETLGKPSMLNGRQQGLLHNTEEPSAVSVHEIQKTTVASSFEYPSSDGVSNKNVTFEEERNADMEVDDAKRKESSSSPTTDQQHSSTRSEVETETYERDCEQEQEHDSGIALLHQAIHAQLPLHSSSLNLLAKHNSQTKDDLLDTEKENSQSQHSHHESSSSLHPSLLFYGSQVSHTSNHSVTCRPGAETQTAAALLSHFAVARSNESSPNVLQE
ncbi:hypothetical protein FisN_1Lh241 [Fistulifera solaris]|uniref:Uncharacterized protein n=1 Tax=Fistulifera solaris TaxID=1519565 RepID=A0A1Z5K4E9_FISSO|nr:hypothetical protein FisN_1Lh241 [Fistulifera solaris]|eukprot:GAX21086.1 hypothetical protein FisN_1Lh241 [Fistulifera solaris]